jgi:hypothetical protein
VPQAKLCFGLIAVEGSRIRPGNEYNLLRELFCENEACQSTIANLMPAIADTDEEMQESALAFLDAVVQTSKERLAKMMLAVQLTGASEGDKIVGGARGKGVGAGGGG